MRVWFRRIVTGLAFAYPVALVVVIGAFRLGGERWWVTAVGLFLPRAGFALPLVVLVPAVLFFKARRAAWAQLIAALLVLFPLMGFTLPGISSNGSGPKVRVLSFNVNSENSSADAVGAAILAHSPDVVLLQESANGSKMADFLRATYGVVQESTQFLLATRYRVTSTTEPSRLAYYEQDRSPRFIRHVIETPLGPIAFYSVHPLSPRGSFYALRGRGLRREIGSGRLIEGTYAREIGANAGLRMLQIEAVGSMSSKEQVPTIVLGDFNQPSLSATFESTLGGYRDAFKQASWGFGYTFPSKRPWMRLDRILMSDTLHAVHFETTCPGVSDHLCVVADIVRAP